MMKLIIYGKVQGVGFRYNVLQHVESHRLSLRGYVRNLPNGAVEILAAGDLESLKQLRKFALKGPASADVRNVEEEYDPPIEDLPDPFIIKS